MQIYCSELAKPATQSLNRVSEQDAKTSQKTNNKKKKEKNKERAITDHIHLKR